MPDRFGSNESTYDALRATTLGANVTPVGNGDATYLRLDASNDPVTGALDVKVDSTSALRVLTSGSAEVVGVDTTNSILRVANRLDFVVGNSLQVTSADQDSNAQYIQFKPTAANKAGVLRVYPSGTPAGFGSSFEFLSSDSNHRMLFVSLSSAGVPTKNVISSDSNITQAAEIPIVFRVGKSDWSGLPDLLTLSSTIISEKLSNPPRGIVEVIINSATSGRTGTQLQFSQTGLADWSIGQPPNVDAFAFYSGRNQVADGTEVARISNAGVITGASYVGLTSDSVTNANTTLTTLTHNSSGTPAANFGLRQLYQLKSSTTTSQEAGAFDVIWTDATHATRTSKLVLSNVISGVETQMLSLSAANQLTLNSYTLTLGGNSSINGTALTGTPGTLTVSTTNVATDPHTHAITSSSAPGATASILASDANGALSLRGLLTLQPSADANKGLIVKGNSATQSANLFEAQTSGGTPKVAIAGTGRTAINLSGTAAPNAAYALYIFDDTTSASGQQTILAEQRISAAANSSTYLGIQFGAVANLLTGALSGTVIGMTGYAGMLSNASYSVANARAADFYVQNYSGSATLTSGTAVYVRNPVGSGTIAEAVGLHIESQTRGSTNYAIKSLGGQSFHAGNLGLGNAGTAFNAAAQLHVLINPATTNSVDEVLRIARNTTGTAAAGLGSSLDWYLESSTTADQLAARDALLWTDATHATRTALRYRETVGNAAQIARHGEWEHNAVSNSAITIVPDGTRDCASVGTFRYAVKDNTSNTTGGGVVVLNPGGAAVTLLSDGTDTLQITCSASGAVTVARSAGTHTFSIAISGSWF